jgi:glutamyl-tRNA synthetase
MSTAELNQRLTPVFQRAGIEIEADSLENITPIIQERIGTLDDAVEMAGFFFQQEVDPDPQDLLGKNLSAGESAQAAQQAHAVLDALGPLELESTEQALRGLADKLQLSAGQLFGILRVAVTGQRVSPPLIESMVLIGKEKVQTRIDQAIGKLQALDRSE